MLTTITLIHNQAHNLNRILASYVEQTRQPDMCIFVLDRCTDNSLNILKSVSTLPVVIIENGIGDGFLAGRMRDLGVKYILDNGIKSDVIFIDGDCVLDNTLIDSVASSLQGNSRCSIIKRRLPIPSGIIYPEARELSPFRIGTIFVAGHDNTVDPANSLRELTTWTCCLGVSYSALNEVLEFMTVYKNVPRLFNDKFDGMWGGEDSFFGLVCMYLNIEIVAINANICITHIYHDSRPSAELYRGLFSSESRALYEYSVNKKLPGSLVASRYYASMQSMMPCIVG